MNTPYDVRMDSDKAKELTERGGALLLLDVPPGTNVAIDQQVFISFNSQSGICVIHEAVNPLPAPPTTTTIFIKRSQ